MKKIFTAIFLAVALVANADDRDIQTTAFTRVLLKSQDAATALTILGSAGSTALTVVTNAANYRISHSTASPFATNSTFSVYATDAILATNVVSGIGITNAVFIEGTNSSSHQNGIEFFQLSDGTFYAAATFTSASNNINSSSVNFVGLGTNGNAIAHYFSQDAGTAADVGLWSPWFGSGFANNFVIDLYNQTTPATNFVPSFTIRWSGKFNAGGFDSHDILKLNSTNYSFNIFPLFGGSAYFHVNLTNGIEDFSAKSHSIPLTGTITGGSGTPSTITGSGTAFLSEVSPGEIVVDTNNVVGLVMAIASDTSMTVIRKDGGAFNAAAGMPLTIQKSSVIGNGISQGTGFINSGGEIGTTRPSGDNAIWVMSGSKAWSINVNSSGGAFRIHDWTSGDTFVMAGGAPDSSVQVLSSGVLDLRYGLQLEARLTAPATPSTGAILWNSNSQNNYILGTNGVSTKYP